MYRVSANKLAKTSSSPLRGSEAGRRSPARTGMPITTAWWVLVVCTCKYRYLAWEILTVKGCLFPTWEANFSTMSLFWSLAPLL